MHRSCKKSADSYDVYIATAAMDVTNIIHDDLMVTITLSLDPQHFVFLW